MNTIHVKKGDVVRILSGDDKGKTGKVLKSFPREHKVIVEGLNTVKKHERARKQGQKGQIIDIPMPMNVSKVTMVDQPKKKKA